MKDDRRSNSANEVSTDNFNNIRTVPPILLFVRLRHPQSMSIPPTTRINFIQHRRYGAAASLSRASKRSGPVVVTLS